MPSKNAQTRHALAHFAALVRRSRERAGYSNARAFYRAQGGTTSFGCTYKAYLNVEKGLSVPQPPLVERLVASLRLALNEERAREFALAYLRVLLGFDEFVEFAVQTLADRRTGAGTLQSPAKSFEERTYSFTPAQSKLLCGDMKRYWTFTLLANDSGRWAPDALARALEFPESDVLNALRALGAEGLVAKDKNGRYFCPHAGRVFQHPKDNPLVPARRDSLKGHWDHMAKKRGGVLLYHPILTRARESELRHYLPYLVQSLLSADLYAARSRGPDTAFFLIQATVQKLLPF